jgi:hypothetical protein
MKTKFLGMVVVAAMALGGTAMACPVGCKCDAAGNVIVNSNNKTTNNNYDNRKITQIDSNNTDKSIHNTATGGAGGKAKSSATSTSGASVEDSGNLVGSGNTTEVKVEGSRAPKIPVASAWAPALTSGYDTCLGSISGGGQTAPVGISFGITKKDETCIFIKKAHLLREFSDRVACVYMREHDADVDRAFTAAGVDCPPEQTFESVRVEEREYVTKEEFNETMNQHDRAVLSHIGK